MLRKHTIKVPINFASGTYSVTKASPDHIFNADIGLSLGRLGVTQSLGTQSISIPENEGASTGISFSSVQLYVGMQDVSNGQMNIGTFSATISIGGRATSSVFVSQGLNSLLNTGENWGGIVGPIDYTNFFNISYGVTISTYQVVDVSVNIQSISSLATGLPGSTARGVYANLDVSYVYDDINPRRANTICIPYESRTASLPVQAAGFPGNTIHSVLPILTGAGGWLDSYNNLTIQNRWLELKGNSNNNNAASVLQAIQWTIGGGGSASLPSRYSVGASDTWQMYQINLMTYSTAATHSLHIWSTIANRWSNLIVNEFITYDFDVVGTTASLNYLEIPINFNSPVAGITQGTTASLLIPNRFVREFNIPEPGPLIVRKAAVEINYNATGSTSPFIRGTGSSFGQRYAIYSQLSSILGIAGQFSFQHGLDSTSINGTGIGLLIKGKNELMIDLYTKLDPHPVSVGKMYNTNGVVKILYESGIASQGIDAHNHTLVGFTRNMSFTASSQDDVVDNFLIPEEHFFLNSAALRFHYWTTTAANSSNFVSQKASFLPEESVSLGLGWNTFYEDNIVGNTEISYGSLYSRIKPDIQSYPGDPTPNLLSITQSRWYRTAFTTQARYGYGFLMAYHSITTTVSGTIYGSAGGVIQLWLFDVDNTAILYASATQSGGGNYFFTVYHSTTSYRVEAYENDLLNGTSKTSTPGTPGTGQSTMGFDIILVSNQTSGYGG